MGASICELCSTLISRNRFSILYSSIQRIVMMSKDVLRILKFFLWGMVISHLGASCKQYKYVVLLRICLYNIHMPCLHSGNYTQRDIIYKETKNHC